MGRVPSDSELPPDSDSDLLGRSDKTIVVESIIFWGMCGILALVVSLGIILIGL